MSEQGAAFSLLQASVDDEYESEFRILVEKKFVKYIIIEGNLYEPDDMVFEPTLVSMLPPLPVGDWNLGYIDRDPTTGKPHFSSTAKEELLGVTSIWHSRQVDYLDLKIGNELRSNVYVAFCPGVDAPIVAKFARFDWEIPQLQAETEVYRWIEGCEIGPAFLGHVTEEGRVIGFLMAYIPETRPATPQDFTLCHDALAKLHELGIKHGDINKNNFLIHSQGATLIDFEVASNDASREDLDAEMGKLMSELDDDSGKGGVIIENDTF